MTSRQRRALRYVGIYTALAPFVLLALFPVAWMTITAFKHIWSRRSSSSCPWCRSWPGWG